ncbi:MAG: cupin domain-containing protein [Eubacteriales bacterium]|nr:cupin domain-containing protein [Eubacteriales bacterium]
MIINDEKGAFVMQITGEYERTLKVLISPEVNKGLKELAAGLSIIPPRSRTDCISHKEGEMFYICEGRGRMTVGDETRDVAGGTVVWVPPGIRHQLSNEGEEILKTLWVLCPPGRERDIISNAGE